MPDISGCIRERVNIHAKFTGITTVRCSLILSSLCLLQLRNAEEFHDILFNHDVCL